MTPSFRSFDFVLHGESFRASLYYDETHGAPWDEYPDAHGRMRCARSRDDKRPGERPTRENRGGDLWLYDVQDAQRRALADGWGLGPVELAALAARLGRTPTRRQIAAEAVRQDYERLRAYLREDWFYVGLKVEHAETGRTEALWGLESDDEGAEMYARELAGDILHDLGRAPEQRRAAWLAALREARERRAWACRDGVTA